MYGHLARSTCSFIWLLFPSAAIWAGEDPAAKHGEFANESLKVGSTTRYYRLVVPKSVELSKAAPIVFAFHGILIDSKDLMPKYTRLNETAEKHGFIIVYPDAIGKSWGLEPKKEKNDLLFFDELLAKLQKSYKVDPNRVYALGMSNGAYFSHVLGKERSKTVAAIAGHSGALGLQTLLGVNAERKFPVLIIHGSQDRIFNVKIAHENRDKYMKEGHLVKYVEIPGLGHSWGTKVNINETIWDFFSKHPLNEKQR
jgi:polyhydroxybutyrate depolymerase